MANAPQWYWPSVDTRRNIGFAIEEAFWAALLVTAASALITAVIVFGGDSDAPGIYALGVLDTTIFASIAFGIRRRSRAAAVVGLILYVSNVIYGFVMVGPRFQMLPALVTLAFLHGVRGTFAYHTLPALPEDLPSVEQGFQALRQSANQETGNSQHK